MKRTRHGIVLGGMSGSVVASLWLAGLPGVAAGTEQPEKQKAVTVPNQTSLDILFSHITESTE